MGKRRNPSIRTRVLGNPGHCPSREASIEILEGRPISNFAHQG
jgi:hypothetical protein